MATRRLSPLFMAALRSALDPRLHGRRLSLGGSGLRAARSTRREEIALASVDRFLDRHRRPHRPRQDRAGQGADGHRRRPPARGEAARHHDRPRFRARGVGRRPRLLRRRAGPRAVRPQHAGGGGRNAGRAAGRGRGRVRDAADARALRDRADARTLAGSRRRHEDRPRLARARRGHALGRAGSDARLLPGRCPDRPGLREDRRGHRGAAADAGRSGARGPRGAMGERRRTAPDRPRVPDPRFRPGRHGEPRVRDDQPRAEARAASGAPARAGAAPRGARPRGGRRPRRRARQRQPRRGRAAGVCGAGSSSRHRARCR